MTSDELGDLLSIAREAARLAGDVIMPLFEAGVAVELKADNTPVTEADRRAEAVIREFLERECPDHGVLGEETGETVGAGRYRWVVDPVDGTKSFIHRVPLFGTLVALERDGEPVVGVIACHAAGETVYAATGMGAFVDGVEVEVSMTQSLSESTVCMTSPAGMLKRYTAAFSELCSHAGLVRSWGDCYGYLMVATGRADVMLDPIVNYWDVAALHPVISEAGGRLTRWTGETELGETSVATNGILHNEVLTLLGEHLVGEKSDP
ncbi:MAG TPA: inositol monophosphatase family protein [Dehalococcoidia bacterium]|nr:inositol monophosphatase family protein [Dehalococcoidia bacterium]